MLSHAPAVSSQDPGLNTLLKSPWQGTAAPRRRYIGRSLRQLLLLTRGSTQGTIESITPTAANPFVSLVAVACDRGYPSITSAAAPPGQALQGLHLLPGPAPESSDACTAAAAAAAEAAAASALQVLRTGLGAVGLRACAAAAAEAM